MIHCCWPRAIWRIATRASLFLFLVAGLATRAAAADTFVVRDVKVDVTAETAAEARDKALAEGEQKAFRLQLERLTSRADWGSLPKLTNEEIATYIQDFEVASEKSSAVRYIATLNYTFKEEPVRRLLADRNTPFAMTRSKPVVVIPVYQDAGASGAPVLWDDPNPWRDAWAARSGSEGLVPLIVPAGDPSDTGAIDVEQALQGNQSSLSAIARRYGAYTALVARATRDDAGAGSPKVKVSLVQYGPGGPEHNSIKTFTGREGESVDELFARAAEATALEMDQVWKGQNLVRVTGRSVTAVTLPITSLSQWLTVEQRLKNVPIVQHTELVVLSRDHARLNLFHMGTPDQLALALKQADLMLSRQDAGVGVGTGAGAGGYGGAGGAETSAGEQETWILRLPSTGAVQSP